MKKRKLRAGFTLVEMLVCILILALLVAGMGSGMSAALRVYRDSIFESDSASLAGILNNAVGDVLRYSEDIKTNAPFRDASGASLPAGEGAGAVNFVFTNVEYGVKDAYFYIPERAEGSTRGPLQLKTLTSSIPKDIVNQGAYPALGIRDFIVTYDTAKKLYTISYTIYSTADTQKARAEQCAVRLLNAPA